MVSRCLFGHAPAPAPAPAPATTDAYGLVVVVDLQVPPELAYANKYSGVGRSMPDARVALYGRQILEVRALTACQKNAVRQPLTRPCSGAACRVLPFSSASGTRTVT